MENYIENLFNDIIAKKYKGNKDTCKDEDILLDETVELMYKLKNILIKGEILTDKQIQLFEIVFASKEKLKTAIRESKRNFSIFTQICTDFKFQHDMNISLEDER